ncbi:MAG: hypothetical protein ACRD2T_07230 [Thermoanaerobaculia bacterium]
MHDCRGQMAADLDRNSDLGGRTGSHQERDREDGRAPPAER